MAHRAKHKRLPCISVVEEQLEDGRWVPAETNSLRLAAFIERDEADRCIYNLEVPSQHVRVRTYQRSGR